MIMQISFFASSQEQNVLKWIEVTKSDNGFIRLNDIRFGSIIKDIVIVSINMKHIIDEKLILCIKVIEVDHLHSILFHGMKTRIKL